MSDNWDRDDNRDYDDNFARNAGYAAGAVGTYIPIPDVSLCINLSLEMNTSPYQFIFQKKERKNSHL